MKRIFALLLSFVAFLSGCSKNDGFGGFWGGYEEQAGDRYTEYGENGFLNTSENPVSTFSVDADGASFACARFYINHGQIPPAAAVRVEEYLNYFTFKYPEPTDGENVSLSSEMTICPWNTAHYLLKLGMKGRTIAPEQMPSSNYVFLIDVSGSMEGVDRLALLKSGFMRMADHLSPNDRISIVTYSGEVKTLLDSANGNQVKEIKAAISKLKASGCTNGGDAIKRAYNLAAKNFITGGNNRIILGTDGDFNFGITSQEKLIELVEQKLESGIYLTVLGVGSGNLNESMMEQLANHGNGNYEYIDCVEQLDKVFINEAQRFHTVAKDSKLQLTFNSESVAQYRLIGYENRTLNKEDFDDDKKDAGEIGSGQTITALYELVPTNSGNELIANWEFRYKKPAESESRLLQHKITSAQVDPINCNCISEDMNLAASLAAFGMILKGSPYKGTADAAMVRSLASGTTTFDPFGYRQAYIDLLNKWNGEGNTPKQ